jgi:parallel beta-helix repeat protein
MKASYSVLSFLFLLGSILFLANFISAPFNDNGSLTQTLYDCGNLNTTNAVYTLNQSIVASGQTCFTVQANNVTIDFNGFNITGDASGADYIYGVLSEFYNDTKVINGIVSGFTVGVRSLNNFGLNVTGGNYSGNGPADDMTNANDGFGIYLFYSNNYSLSDFEVRDIRESTSGGLIAVAEVIESLMLKDYTIDVRKEIFGIGDNMSYLEDEICYGDYCNLSEDDLKKDVDIAIENSLNFQLNAPLDDEITSNNFNHIFLLKIANEIEPNDKIEQALPGMLQEFIDSLNPTEYDMYLPYFNIIDNKFDEKESKYYQSIKTMAPSNTDFMKINKQLGIISYYCQDIFMNYNEKDKQFIIDYLTKTALGEEVKQEDDYYYPTTHALFYLNMMYLQGCIEESDVQKAADATLLRNKLFTKWSDPYLEGPFALLTTNHSEMMRDWIPIILENQNEDGGFPIYTGLESRAHSTGLGLVTLLAYRKYVLNNESYNFNFPFKPLEYSTEYTKPDFPEHHSTYGVYAYESNYGYINNVNGSGCSIYVGAICTSSNSGIYLQGSSYTNISNCDMSNLSSGGITLMINGATRSNYNNLFSNTANSDGVGISISYGDYNTIKDNSLDSTLNYGIFIAAGFNNTIQNNTISKSYIGIESQSSSGNNITDNNIQGCTSDTNSGCIYLYYNDHDYFARNVINSSTGYGIYIYFGNNNLFKDMNITNIALDSIILDRSLNNTFVNVTYNNESLSAISSTLIRKWYYKTNIDWSLGGIVNSGNVWALNKTNSLEFNATISSGTIPMQEITDYVNNGTTKYYYSLYNITATNGTVSSTHSFNASLGNNYTDVFVLEGGGAPVSIGIPWVQSISSITLTGGTTKNVYIAFNVTGDDINSSSGQIVLKNGVESRTSNSCSNISSTYNCTIVFQFYDSAGSWNINATIKDTSNNLAVNDTTSTTVNALDYITQDITSLSWTSLAVGSNDNEASVPMILSNKGNQDYSNISIKAYNCTGQSYSDKIPATKFSNDNVTGATSGQTYLQEDIYIQNTKLTKLNQHGASISQSIYFYVDIPLNIRADTYISDNTWKIKAIT